MTENVTKNILTATTDFNGWFRIMKSKLEKMGYCDRKGNVINSMPAGQNQPGANHERNTYLTIMEHLHASEAAFIPQYVDDDDCSGTKLIKYLIETRVGGNKYELIQKYREYRMGSKTNAEQYLKDIGKMETQISHAGGKLNATERFAKLTSDLNQEFYDMFITNTRLEYNPDKEDPKEINDKELTKITSNLLRFYNAKPKPERREREYEQRETVRKTNFEERNCSICKEQYGDKNVKDRKIKIYQTHDTKDHQSRKKAYEKGENKSGSQYSRVLLDSCASTHFVKEIPLILNTKSQGIVKGSVSGSAEAKIIGTGEFQTGNLKFTASVAPRLDANLLSAGKLVKEGYAAVLKRNIIPGVDLTITKDNQTIATGYVTSNNMLEINETMKETSSHNIKKTDAMIDHKIHAHLGSCECTICLEAKRRKSNVSKGKGRTYDSMEKISVDMQGPISIKGVDGSRYNMKMVDAKSKYITIVPTIDKTSKTTADIYTYFIKRKEKRLEKESNIQ